MTQTANPEPPNAQHKNAFAAFATKRMIFGIAIAIAILWGISSIIEYFRTPPPPPVAVQTDIQHAPPAETPGVARRISNKPYALLGDRRQPASQHLDMSRLTRATDSAPAAAPHVQEADRVPAPIEIQPAPRVKGLAFVAAAVQPLSYELEDRWWGWRVNDILDVTDNVNNFQLGVLEVTRRTAVILAERLSRTGATASFDHGLENAMNWLMIKSDRYWFPSAESKYKDSIAEISKYADRLARGEARFFTRPDNLIPLLASYEDLLGSCDENLVKAEEDGGRHVSHFKSDDYFYYAQGVANAMHGILLAVSDDFQQTIETRRGLDVLHHAIESLHRAMEMHPWYITNAELSGILANHRANMAAPISHARFYLSVLIKTLST